MINQYYSREQLFNINSPMKNHNCLALEHNRDARMSILQISKISISPELNCLLEC